MLDFAIFAVTFVVVLIIAVVWVYPGSKKVTTIPGLEPSTNDDGNFSDIDRAGSLHEFLVELHEKFGPIAGFWWGQMYVVSIASPELFKQHSNVFDRALPLYELFKPVFGAASLTYLNGAEGRTRRRIYDRALQHSRLIAQFETFQKLINKVVKKWENRGEDDHIPLSEEMFSFAITASLIALLGNDFEDEKLARSVKNAYDKMWAEMEYRLIHPVIPPDHDPRVKTFNEAKSYVHKTIMKVVERHRQATAQGQLLIDEIVASTDDEDVIKDDCITFMVASFHTTANLLTWALYFLATHTECQDKLFEEIHDILGDSGVVDDSNLDKFKYLTQVVNETLRCAIVGPWTARYQDFDTELGGHTIPKNTPVIHALGVVLHDETIFPEPNKFDPERFSPDNVKDIPPLAFSPLGFSGKRNCPGEKYTRFEAAVVLSTIIRSFEVSMYNDEVVQPAFGFVTHPQDEIWLKVKKRKGVA